MRHKLSPKKKKKKKKKTNKQNGPKEVGETGAKWAPSKIVLIIFKKFENNN